MTLRTSSRPMIKDYLHTLWRSLARQPLIALINVGGLSIGITAALLIALHVRDELSFDRQFPGAENILRVEERVHLKGTSFPASAQLAMAAARELENFGAPILAKTTLFASSRIVRHGVEQHFESVMYASANFFEVFDFSSMIDQPARALGNANSILISEEMATRYFVDEPALGGVLTVGEDLDYTVVGVFPRLPRNIHIRFDFLALFDEQRDMPRAQRANWTTPTTFTYIQIAEDTDIEDLGQRLEVFLQDGAHRQWPRDGTVSFGFKLQPLTDIHLFGESRFDMVTPGSIDTVLTFIGIAVLILTVASINYINLTTARASQRAREVSLRKALGATRAQLIGQFLFESVLTTGVALTVAILLLSLVLPWFNDFMDKDLHWTLFEEPMQIVFVVIVLLGVGLLGGLYPALVLSAFQPARVLRGNQSTASGSPWLRHALVVLQYSVSAVLILVTVMMVEQTEFARRYDLGFDPALKINIDVRHKAAQLQIGALEGEFRAIPEVVGFSMMKRPLPGGISFLWEMSIPQFAVEGGRRVANYEVDEDFFSVFQIDVLAGRTFSPNFQADVFVPPDKRGQDNADEEFHVGNIVANESLLAAFGIPDAESALGARVFIEPQNDFRRVEAIIVGVVADVHFDSIHSEVRAGYYSLRRKDELGAMVLVLASDNLAAGLAAVDDVWRKIVPGVPISRIFVDTTFHDLYHLEERRGQLFSYFAALTIALSCLGLFGLSSFTASRRRKEIAIRKVLGASVWHILLLLLIQFTRPVVIAGLIGIPVALLFVDNWLQGFAYRISLTDFLYLLPLMLATLLAVSWLTVLFHTVQAARTKPADAIRMD